MGEKAAEIIDGGGGHRVNGWVDAYTKFVIKSLVGTKGRSETAVVATLLSEWIKDNRADLEKMGLWPPQVRAGRPVVVPPGA
ncbi:MAG: hypothetical protein ACT4O1_03800 [Gemmatimonadota bacterium]